MQKVKIDVSRSYDVLIGRHLLETIGDEVKKLSGKIRTVCVVSETTVYPLHGKKVEDSLQNAGFKVCSFVFPAGEASKNGNTYLELLNHLAMNRLTRSDLLVALGGGVVGDLTGFAAASFLRGIPFIQVPTTVLSAVDSSVGGKTAIDLPAGKNLAGAFYQPSLVLCDIDTLDTLPRDIFLDGCAEIIKDSVIFDKALFEYLRTAGPEFDREYVIRRCVEIKRDVVMEDEFDTGSRMKLNLGHTIGHGVEAKSNFSLSHGKSVAIGLAIVCRAAAKRGILDPESAKSIQDVLLRFGLPLSTDYPADELLQFILSDKKRSGNTIPLIIPTTIGHCEIMPTPVDDLKALIEAGL